MLCRNCDTDDASVRKGETGILIKRIAMDLEARFANFVLRDVS